MLDGFVAGSVVPVKSSSSTDCSKAQDASVRVLTDLACRPPPFFFLQNRYWRPATQNLPASSPTLFGTPKPPPPQKLHSLHQIPRLSTVLTFMRQRKESCLSDQITIHTTQTTSMAQAGVLHSDQITTPEMQWRLPTLRVHRRQSSCSRGTEGNSTLALQRQTSKHPTSRCRTRKQSPQQHCTTTTNKAGSRGQQTE